MKIFVYKNRLMGLWHWVCPVCHHDMNVPWGQVDTWLDALSEVDEHLTRHREAGMRSEWTVVL